MSKKQQSKYPKSSTKNAFLFIFLCIYIVLSLLLFDPKLFTGGDNAVYINLAESVTMGKGYSDIHLPDEPPHTQYPPGFPLLLSLFLFVFGPNFIVLKFVTLLCGVASLYFMYGISRHLFKEKVNIIIPLYLSVPIFVIYNHWILSEIPFLCFSLGSLYFFIKAHKNKQIFYYLSFILAVYSFFIRTAGISLIIGIMFVLLLKRQYTFFGIFLFIFLAAFLPWLIRNARIPTEGSYIDQLLTKNPYQPELGKIGVFDLISRAWSNFTLYSFTILPMMLLPVIKASGLLRIVGFITGISVLIKAGWLLRIVGFIFLLLAVIGFIRRIKSISVIESYFIFGVITILGWPSVWSSDRFLLPILPIIIVYAFTALSWFTQKIKSKYFMPVVVGTVIILNMSAIVLHVTAAVSHSITYIRGDRYSGYTQDWRRYFELIEWINESIPEDKIIMARKPEYVYLLSRHKSFIYPFTTDSNKLEEAIHNADYILVDSFYWTGTTRRYLLPVLQRAPEKYEVVYRTRMPEFYLLKVK